VAFLAALVVYAVLPVRAHVVLAEVESGSFGAATRPKSTQVGTLWSDQKKAFEGLISSS
jgi:hypothetical protein